MASYDAQFEAALRHKRKEENHFILEVRKQYQGLVNREFYDDGYPRGSALRYAELCYEEGRYVRRLLSGTFHEFFGFLNHEYFYSVWSWNSESSPYHRRYRHRDPWNYFYSRHKTTYRVPLSYVRNVEHLPKEEPVKAAWRAHKQFARDKSKGKRHRHDKARRWGKRFSNDKNRAFVRREMDLERYERLPKTSRGIVRMWWD